MTENLDATFGEAVMHVRALRRIGHQVSRYSFLAQSL